MIQVQNLKYLDQKYEVLSVGILLLIYIQDFGAELAYLHMLPKHRGKMVFSMLLQGVRQML